ncbi:hypothetical protein SANT12839_087720 [Streptomyces antimycoticus]|uniref:Uncharacterized protein n=1 Tax=Streptomyces antimycoticus TaxID=68175 RepID=A0A4D4KMN5_9ACTN|nr:hypothetical protein SANT12839_087720 [Streptomyces antimycoticus]
MASPNLFLSKSDLAYAELRRQILSGNLPAGSRLAQYDLAESLSMSITPCGRQSAGSAARACSTSTPTATSACPP